MQSHFVASVALAVAAPFAALSLAQAEPAAAAAPDNAASRAALEARLLAVEQQLKAAQAAPASTSAPTPAPAPSPAGSAANAYNPAISLVLSGLYANTSRDPAAYRIAGFSLPSGAEIGPGTRSFSLAETELGFAANIDPWLRGVANLALHADDAVSVEEAYLQTTSWGQGLQLKAGRFFSGVGYLNAQHAHTWDFVDNPLAYQALLGTQYGDDGVQLTWLAPTDRYLQLGAELGRGRSYPGGDNARNGAGMWSLAAHSGGDVGESHTWRAGVSVLSARAQDQGLVGVDAAGADVNNAFSGRTRVWVADAVWKWAPGGNATRTNLKLQGEYLHSTRSGSLVYDVGGADSAGAYRARQSGWYVQGVYQFMPRWRVGLRTEALNAGSPDYGSNAGLLAANTHTPQKHTLMLDFNPSEFSRVRVQLAQDRANAGAADRQLFIQYQASLGAHGAHSY
jgi:hypothetical protein